jgi:hypothetical protein
MNVADAQWWERLFATDNPLLPTLWLMQACLSLGWAVVTAGLGAVLAQKLSRHSHWAAGAATVCALWAWLPGPYSSSYWLGLAFQMPSICAVLLSAALLWDLFANARGQAQGRKGGKDHRAAIGWAVAGVALSACLALDTFAVFPVSVYAWGFSGFAVVVALGSSLLPWVIWHNDRSGALHWIVPLAIALFVALRLPTGNLWDALLDPWLGVGLTVYLWRQRTSR